MAAPVGPSTSACGPHKGCQKELVVARYKEDISWLERVDFAVTVYNTGPRMDCTIRHVHVIDMPNVKRESGAYLQHIVTRYDSLADVTFFCQGHPFDHSHDFVERLAHAYDEPTCLSYQYLPDIPDQWIKDLDLVTEKFGHVIRMGDALVQAHAQIPDWFDPAGWDYVFDCPMPRPLYFGYSAQYAVPKRFLRLRPVTFWRWLYDECDSGANGLSRTCPKCVNPWMLEGVFACLWRGDLYPHKEPRPEPPPTRPEPDQAELRRRKIELLEMQRKQRLKAGGCGGCGGRRR